MRFCLGSAHRLASGAFASCLVLAGCGDSAGGESRAAPVWEPTLDAGACAWPADERVSVPAVAVHVQGSVDYGPGAPAGGDHAPCWGRWGVHTTPLPAENFVHNLEHGGVALLYNCPDGCDAEVRALEGFGQSHELTIVTRYRDMENRFAVTAWGYLVESDCLSEEGLAAFYDEHVDRAPEQFGRPPPEPPASCE